MTRAKQTVLQTSALPAQVGRSTQTGDFNEHSETFRRFDGYRVVAGCPSVRPNLCNAAESADKTANSGGRARQSHHCERLQTKVIAARQVPPRLLASSRDGLASASCGILLERK